MNSNHTNLLRALASTTSVPADDIKDGPCHTILYGNINRRYTLSCKRSVSSPFFFAIEDTKIPNR